jgi:DNA-binding CsgD family transcriptional regulator
VVNDFEDYVEKANAASSIDELFSVYLKAVGRHGLDRALFALITDHSDIGKPAGIGVIHNFPQDWMAHYFEQGYDRIDPVPIYGASQFGAYKWDEVPQRMDLTKTQQRCLNLGIEAGLNHGVATFLRGIRNQVAGVSLASSEKKDAFDGKIDLITAYSNHFYAKYRLMHEIRDPEPVNLFLTPQEKEILEWVAEGKKDFEVGEIMMISEATVNFHMRNIMKKTNSHNRVTAVVKALAYGLICPATYRNW